MAELFAAPQIISASRRTDIPRYFGRWLDQRRRAGSASFRSAFGVPGEVSLRPADVIGYLFWTKNARPFRSQLCSLRAEGMPYVFQYALNAYGPEIEPNQPDLGRLIDDFLAVAADLPGPGAIQWRYDPILLSETYDRAFHLDRFGRLARALAGATRVVNVSLLEPYLKALRRMPAGISYRRVDPSRHKTVARDYPDLPQADEEVAGLLADLRAVAGANGMELRACSNPELGLPASQCCGAELFAAHGARVRAQVAGLRARATRPGCQCLATVDIGMDNTCLNGCKYCYVVTSQGAAIDNFRRHDPNADGLR